jgi:circadian clock protein KaiB
MSDRNPVQDSGVAAPDIWLLRLYIAGQSTKSLAAISNLHRFCETYLANRHQIEVVDLLLNPELAEQEKIIAIPTLVRLSPEPVRRIIGDLSDTEKILLTLQLKYRHS